MSFQKLSLHVILSPKTTAEQLTNETRVLLEGLSDDDFDKIISTSQAFGQDVPGSVLLAMSLDHEIHHKGQLFVYARMLGFDKVPPFAMMK